MYLRRHNHEIICFKVENTIWAINFDPKEIANSSVLRGLIKERHPLMLLLQCIYILPFHNWYLYTIAYKLGWVFHIWDRLHCMRFAFSQKSLSRSYLNLSLDKYLIRDKCHTWKCVLAREHTDISQLTQYPSCLYVFKGFCALAVLTKWVKSS